MFICMFGFMPMFMAPFMPRPMFKSMPMLLLGCWTRLLPFGIAFIIGSIGIALSDSVASDAGNGIASAAVADEVDSAADKVADVVALLAALVGEFSSSGKSIMPAAEDAAPAGSPSIDVVSIIIMPALKSNPVGFRSMAPPPILNWFRYLLSLGRPMPKSPTKECESI